MADDDDKPTIRRSADNHRTFVVEYRGEILGHFSSQDDAAIWIDKIKSERDTEKEKQRQPDEYLCHKAMGRLKDDIDRRRENGIGQRDSDRRKKIAKELEGFEYPHLPLKTTGHMRLNYGNGLYGVATVVQMADRETVSEWQKNARDAANKYRKAQRNRAKQSDATSQAKIAKNAATEQKKRAVAELVRLGKTNKQIAEELGLSIRQVQRLKNKNRGVTNPRDAKIKRIVPV